MDVGPRILVRQDKVTVNLVISTQVAVGYTTFVMTTTYVYVVYDHWSNVVPTSSITRNKYVINIYQAVHVHGQCLAETDISSSGPVSCR